MKKLEKDNKERYVYINDPRNPRKKVDLYEQYKEVAKGGRLKMKGRTWVAIPKTEYGQKWKMSDIINLTDWDQRLSSRSKVLCFKCYPQQVNLHHIQCNPLSYHGQSDWLKRHCRGNKQLSADLTQKANQ